MVITGTTLVSLVILVVALVLMPGAQAWWLRLIWFFLSLGAAITLMLGFGISAGPAALMSAAIFGIMAIASLRRVKGGKGVSTFIGGLIAACWPAALAFALVWLLIAAVTRYSSAAALAASVVAPLIAIRFGGERVALTFAILAALIWMKHVANIRRLARGTEPRIGAKA